jgi:acyl-lipid omega-6 desaturase (Delta-12 desaturase)
MPIAILYMGCILQHLPECLGGLFLMINDSKLTGGGNASDAANWKQIVAHYQKPSVPRAVWQLVNTFVPYIGLWVLMHFTMSISWWLTIPLAILAGAILVRAFIIFHDCGHGSYFKSATANHIFGAITGVFTFTPFYHWRWEHAIHHSSSGDLDRRGTGDIWTLTVQEYLESSRWKRFAYRLARNPVILFVIAPLFLFLIQQRVPKLKAPTRERYSVYWTNLALGTIAAILIAFFGLKAFLIIQLTILTTAGATGVWLFYVQHQFEGVYWERQDDWDYVQAALQGSSFYKLPRILQWFSGNIGYHHIHHLSPRIPNYHLEKCHREQPLFQTVKPVTFFASFKSLTFRLWDERKRQLVGFHHIRNRIRIPRRRRSAPQAG